MQKISDEKNFVLFYFTEEMLLGRNVVLLKGQWTKQQALFIFFYRWLPLQSTYVPTT